MIPGAAPRGQGPRLAASICLCLALLGACVKESPLIPAGDVYDPKDALSRAHLDGVDSVQVILVDAADSSRTLRLWSGTMDTLSRIPVHVAQQGECFFFRIEGFRRGRGLCYVETLRESEGRITLDACLAAAVPARFRDSLLDFEGGGPERPVRIQGLGGFAGRLELSTRLPWILLFPDTVRFAPGSDSAQALALIHRGLMEPGDYRGRIYLRDSGRVLDSLEARASSPSIRIFPAQGVDFGNGDSARTIPVHLPITENPAWLPDPGLPWLRLVRAWKDGEKPGTPTSFTLTVLRDSLAKGSHSAWIRAYGRGGRAMDSLRVTASKDAWPGGIAGLSLGSDHVPVPGVSLDLIRTDTAGERLHRQATSDSSGRFAFSGLPPGRYKLCAARAGRMGSVKPITVSDSTDSVKVGVGKPAAFAPVLPGWARGALGRPALISSGWVVAPSRAPQGEGRILWFPAGAPGEARLVPQGNLADSATGRAMQPAEMDGDSLHLYVTYPFDSTLAAIRSWRQAPSVRRVRLPFRPSGIKLDAPILAVVGRHADNRLLLAELNAATLVLLRIDTLPVGDLPSPPADAGREWLLDNGPRVYCDTGRYYLTDGTWNQANGQGQVVVKRKSSKGVDGVKAWPNLGLTGVSTLLLYPGWQPILPNGSDFYAAGRYGIQGGKAGESKSAVLRIATPPLADLALYINLDIFSGFQDLALAVSPEADSLLLYNLQIDRPMGRIPLPGPGTRILATSPGHVAIAVGSEIHAASVFE